MTVRTEAGANEGDRLYFNANMFQTTADDLQNGINRLTRSLGKIPDREIILDIPSREYTRVSGYSCASVILRALAAECVRKAIAFKTSGNFRTDRDGHNLEVIFDDLTDPVKALISKCARKEGLRSPKEILTEHRVDFVDWRYPTADNETRNVNVLDLPKTVGLLMRVYKHYDLPQV